MIFLRSPAARLRPLMLAALVLLAVLAACERFVEPPQDQRLVSAIEALATETDALFTGFYTETAEVRATRYAALDAAAEAIAGRAQARAATLAVEPDQGPYGVATAGFMADYRRNLGWLATADSAAGPYGLLPPVVALRRAAMTDAVQDALVYERDLLTRFP